MNKSLYGKDITYFLKAEHPLLGCNQVLMREVPSTFTLSQETQRKIEERWNQEHNGKRPLHEEEWRYEGFSIEGDKLYLLVSPTSYIWHNILRAGDGLASYVEMTSDRTTETGLLSLYPTPITVNSVQETTDGFIPVAVRKTKSAGGTSDQRGLCTLGSGFFGRVVKDGENVPSRNPFSVAYTECHEESKYDLPCPESAFNVQDARLLGLIRGSNTDMTATIYIPLDVTHTKISLNPESREHSDLWFLSTDCDSLKKFLIEGGIAGIPAADHLLGSIELYSINRHLRTL